MFILEKSISLNERRAVKIRKQRIKEDLRSIMISLGHSTQPVSALQANRELIQLLLKINQVLWHYFGCWRTVFFQWASW